MNRLCRTIAVVSLACSFLGCDGGGAADGTPQQSDPNAAAAEAKKLMGDMKPGPNKLNPAK